MIHSALPPQAGRPDRERADGPDGPSLDSRPLALLRDYAALLGAPVTEAEGTITLDLPESEAGFFRARRLVVALMIPESLALHPDAEALVPGSDLLARLTAAIRARAGRLVHGVLEPTLTPACAGTPLDLPLRGATSSEARVSLSRLPVGRLLARVLVGTGATVEERLVRSGTVDLVHGRPVSPAIAEACER